MSPKELVEKILDTYFNDQKTKCPPDITLQVFDVIAEKYKSEYLQLERNYKTRGALNQQIGKAIKAHWNLINSESNVETPNHELITSYTILFPEKRY